MKNVRKAAYPVIFSAEGGDAIEIFFPDFRAAATAYTPEEAEASARELLFCLLNGTDADRWPEPTPLEEIGIRENEEAELVEIELILPGEGTAPDKKTPR